MSDPYPLVTNGDAQLRRTGSGGQWYTVGTSSREHTVLSLKVAINGIPRENPPPYSKSVIKKGGILPNLTKKIRLRRAGASKTLFLDVLAKNTALIFDDVRTLSHQPCSELSEQVEHANMSRHAK